MRSFVHTIAGVLAGGALLGLLAVPDAPAPAHVDEARATERADEGRALFMHSWTRADPRSVAGNGLGPYFNATSCVGCHSRGGAGGGGSRDHNVNIVGGFVAHRQSWPGVGVPLGAPAGFGGLGIGGLTTATLRFVRGRAPLVRGARNAPALFGAGLIDAIPDETIIAEAQARDPRWPDIRGRVGRDATGAVARFGWKGDVARLSTFVAQAAANELGLTNPGQAETVPASAERSPDLDLDQADLDALVAFVARLPRPVEEPPSALVERGAQVFEAVGCTACHRPRLGAVRGLYSDLLLHDLGAQLVDGAGGYYGAPLKDEQAPLWRTPPLWGLRDSAPYLHDGRATTVDDAVRAHAGEAEPVRGLYEALPPVEREALLSFLDTLQAP